MNPGISIKKLILATAFSLGTAATAFAVAPGDGERCGPGRSMGSMAQGMQHGMKALSRLHGDLKLDATQEALWQDAEKASKDNLGSMRQRINEQRKAALTMLDQPGADLRAVMKQMDEAKDAGRQQHEANRERWLAVYDSLNADQKEKARLFLKSQLERSERKPGGTDKK